jgi:Ca2+:H+ antiporter
LNLNLLLIFLPISLLARLLNWGDLFVFVASALAIIPLSGLLGGATEALAAKLGQRIGGLLNATLGNAAELIITIFALSAGLTDLVKASLIGSVLGNLLLVTGFSFLVGGLKNGLQTFDRRTASLNTTLMILAFLTLVIPSSFDGALLGSPTDPTGHELFFSVGIALVMIVIYALSLIYSLRSPQTHEEAVEIEEAVTPGTEPNIRRALIMLGLATVGIVLMSESLVATVEPVAHAIGLSEFFVGIIIVPLIGNVAEHVVAMQVAFKNRMDLSLGISIGSSLQIALFVTPVLVFISLLFPKHLLLVFTPYELLALATASIVATLVSQDGESNWLEGAQLLAVYVILALAFFLLPTAL